MKNLLMQLQCICNGLKDKYENNIMKKYSDNAKLYTVILTSKTNF